MSKIAKLLAMVLVFLLLMGTTCGKKKSTESPPPTPSNELAVEGMVDLPQGSPYSKESLSVISVFTSSKVDSSGGFSGTFPESTTTGALFATNQNGDPLLLTYVFSSGQNPLGKLNGPGESPRIIIANGEVDMNAQTTALTLVMLSPLLIDSDQQQRNQFAQIAVSNAHFPELVSTVEQQIKSGESDYLINTMVSPRLWELTALIQKETYESFDTTKGLLAPSEISFPTRPMPSIEDLAGAKVKFINPYYIYYGIGIYKKETNEKKDLLYQLPRNFKWGIPYIGSYGEKEYSLGDGQFSVYFYKGYFPFESQSWNHGCGRGFWPNTAKGILNVIDIFVSIPGVTKGEKPVLLLLDNISRIHGITELIQSTVELDNIDEVPSWLISLANVIVRNLDVLRDLLFEMVTDHDNLEHYMKTLGGIAENIAPFLKVYKIGSKVPFFADLLLPPPLFAPGKVVYNVQQVNGVLSTVDDDTIAPSRITNLSAGNPTSTSIELTWTAPGDDGNSGTASQYDIRYSTSTITSSNWSSATQCSGEPTPSIVGSSESFTVTELNSDTKYYFVMKTADEVSNWSVLSNVDSAVTLKQNIEFDEITDPRDAKTYKTVKIGSQWWMAENLNFEVPHGSWCYNDNCAEYAGTYGRLYDWETACNSCPPGWHLPTMEEMIALIDYLGGSGVAGGKMKASGTIEAGDGLWHEPNTGATNESGFSALPGGGRCMAFENIGWFAEFWTSYSGTGWAADYALPLFLWSSREIAQCDTYVLIKKTCAKSVRCILNGSSDPTPPAAVTNLATSNPTSSSIKLTWTAPGDDGDSGTASQYDIRYSTSNITPSDWNSATQCGDEPTPKVAGSSESYTVTGLTPDTKYYFAMKTADEVPNWSGLSNVPSGKTEPGDSTTVTDIDGNVYKTIKIGNQWWMAENLKVTHYRNGDPIPNVADNSTWEGLSTGAYCNYNNDEGNVATYGRLYNWFAVVDSRNIAPAGWHVPTDAEWQTLVDYLGGSAIAGGKMKETSTTHWNSPNTGATNESGFTALPGGYCYYFDGTFFGMGYFAFFWSSTETETYSGYVLAHYLSYGGTRIVRDSYHERKGFSVRCVGD
jgi:uncharacterized protein (TIGR02145 family)